jgi:phosphotransacetylase
MPLFGFDRLFQDAGSLQSPVSVAVAGANDRTVLEALRAASDRGWVTAVLVGPAAEIRRSADEAGVELDGFTLIDVEETAAAAVAQVRSGRAQMLMKGRVSTPSLMRALLDSSAGLRTQRVICQVVLMEILATPPHSAARRFLLADTGICIQPTLEQKADIIRSAVEVAHGLGAEQPRVALLAASEAATEAMPETLDAVELKRRSESGEFPGCILDGPLSFDLAYAADAVAAKGVSGPVAGAADILVFPNLVSANLTTKAMMYTAPCRFGGVLCGAACPVVFMSRADTTETRLNSLALALSSVAKGQLSPVTADRQNR